MGCPALRTIWEEYDTILNPPPNYYFIGAFTGGRMNECWSSIVQTLSIDLGGKVPPRRLPSERLVDEERIFAAMMGKYPH
jgi:hypothetical protein